MLKRIGNAIQHQKKRLKGHFFQPPENGKMLFESLEPRLLLSADLPIVSPDVIPVDDSQVVLAGDQVPILISVQVRRILNLSVCLPMWWVCKML